MSSDEFSSILKDSTEEGWRQLDSIKKLSTFKNDQSLETLFQLAFSSKQDPHGILYGGTESYRLSRTSFELKHSSEIRWTAAESISQMGNYPFSKIMEYVEDRKQYYLAHSEEHRHSSSQDSIKALIEDLKILIWILGELGTEKSIEICKPIYNSRKFSRGLQTYAMNALRKNDNLDRQIFIENLRTDEDAREFRYYLAGTALASYGVSILPELMVVEIENDVKVLTRIIDILNHINNERFNETIIDFFLDILSKYDLASKKSDTDYYKTNENVPTVYIVRLEVH